MGTTATAVRYESTSGMLGFLVLTWYKLHLLTSEFSNKEDSDSEVENVSYFPFGVEWKVKPDRTTRSTLQEMGNGNKQPMWVKHPKVVDQN